MRPFDWQAMWTPLLPPWEVALRAALIYVFVLVLFRLAGRKELGRYSMFDVALLFLITVAARTSILAEDSSLTSAMVGLSTIVGIDWLFSLLSFRSVRARRVLEGSIYQLVRHGEIVDDEMRRARVSREELIASLRRQHGTDDLEVVRHAFMGTSGELSFVLREPPAHGRTATFNTPSSREPNSS